jgi:hypothetical protein
LKTRNLLIATAMCASSGAWAADVSQTINPLVEATKVMDRCAAIATKISSTPVPAGHGEAVAAAFHNETMAKENAKAAPGKAAAPGQMKVVAPDQQAFFAMIQVERDNLQKCGEDYQKVHHTAEVISDKAGAALEKATNPTEDDKKVGAAAMAFEKSEEKLVAAISKLSKDVNYERYVGAVVNKYFLEPVKK